MVARKGLAFAALVAKLREMEEWNSQSTFCLSMGKQDGEPNKYNGMNEGKNEAIRLTTKATARASTLSSTANKFEMPLHPTRLHLHVRQELLQALKCHFTLADQEVVAFHTHSTDLHS